MEDKLSPFDFGPQDIAHLKSTSKNTPNMRRQVVIGYYAACSSHGIDPIPILNNAGFGIQF
jgi:hypothetical protein